MKKDKQTLNNYYEVIEVTNNWLHSLKRFKKLNSWLVCNGILYSVLGMIYGVSPSKRAARGLLLEAVKHFEQQNKI